MYSKKQMGYPSGGYSITPPPGYDGSRFKSRSDGRDDAFPPYDKPARTYTAEKKPSDNNTRSSTYDDDDVFSFDTPKAEKSNSIFPILKNGISNEELPFVFDRFYKSDKSRGLDKTGVGLGLYIARTIIDAHEEQIFVRSEYEKNCEFVFTLAQGK